MELTRMDVSASSEQKSQVMNGFIVKKKWLKIQLGGPK